MACEPWSNTPSVTLHCCTKQQVEGIRLGRLVATWSHQRDYSAWVAWRKGKAQTGQASLGRAVEVPRQLQEEIFQETSNFLPTVFQTLGFYYKPRMQPQGLSGEIPGFPSESMTVLNQDKPVANPRSEQLLLFLSPGNPGSPTRVALQLQGASA